MASNRQKMQQMRCRYAHELKLLQHQQQQQQEQQQQLLLQSEAAMETAPPRVPIRNSLLDSPDVCRMFRRLQRSGCDESSCRSREQETKELLQSRLQRFFSSLQTARPPSLLPGPIRASVDLRRSPSPRGPPAQTVTSSSLTMASQQAAPPTSSMADASLSMTLNSTSSLDAVTSAESYYSGCGRQMAATALSAPPPAPLPPPTPQPPPLPPPHRHRHPSQPPPPQFHCRPQGARSSSLTHLTHRSSYGSQQQLAQRLLSLRCSRAPTTESQSMPVSPRFVSMTRRDCHQQQRESLTAPVPKPRALHRRQATTPISAPAYAAAAAAATAAAVAGSNSRPVCQVFHVSDVESVQASLITREDRRVLKILGQFDCRAEVLDTVLLSAKRSASIVYIAGPNGQHLNWCVDRIQDLFPSWELKCQMRNCKVR